MAEEKEQDQSQKTEEATERSLEKAREKGQIPLSKEVNHLFILMAGALIIVSFGPLWAKRLTHHIEHFLYFSQYDIVQALTLIKFTLFNVGTDLGLAFIIFVLAALGAGLSQTRFLVSFESLKPQLSKISIRQGIKKIFGLKNLTEFLKGILKICIVGGAAYFIIRPEVEKAQILPYYLMSSLLSDLHYLLKLLFVVVLSVMTVIAILDYMYQRFDYLRRMRMSRQDIKEEAKETEGDPLIRQKLRELRRERARNRMMAAVPKATVILTNPTHYAVALAYEHGVSHAPKVVAKGADLVAFRIRDLGKKNDVPIVENPPLARALYEAVPLNQEIPEKYYQAVAQVIRYVMGLEKRK